MNRKNKELVERARDLMTITDMNSMSLDEIAVKFNISKASVRNIIHEKFLSLKFKSIKSAGRGLEGAFWAD